jgi:predicted HNH restriction endonuclease
VVNEGNHGVSRITPQTDLSVLCLNRHAMIHRKEDQTLSLKELRDLIPKNACRKTAQRGE